MNEQDGSRPSRVQPEHGLAVSGNGEGKPAGGDIAEFVSGEEVYDLGCLVGKTGDAAGDGDVLV